MSFYIGSWCDVIGRKFVIYLCMMARVLSVGFQLLCVVFMDWPKELLLVATFINSIGGEFHTFCYGIYSIDVHYG